MKLTEEQRQSLITSLLGFVRRVSFHGADSPEEAESLPIVIALLLGKSWLFTGEEETLSKSCEEEAESEESQKSENNGTCPARECGCCRCFVRKT